MAPRWAPDSWRSKPIEQAPGDPHSTKLAEVEQQLATFSAAGVRRRGARS